MYKKFVKVLLIAIVVLAVGGIGFSYSKVKENTQVGSVMNDFVVCADEEIDQENKTQNDIVQNFVEENVVDDVVVADDTVVEEKVIDTKDVEEKNIETQEKSNVNSTTTAIKLKQKTTSNSQKEVESVKNETKIKGTTDNSSVIQNEENTNTPKEDKPTEIKIAEETNQVENKQETVTTIEEINEPIVKSIYDFEFDINAIRQEMISYGESIGLEHITEFDGEKITPENSSWCNPITASKNYQGKKLEKKLKEYISYMPQFVSDYGKGRKIKYFTIYVEDIGNGSYNFYFLY